VAAVLGVEEKRTGKRGTQTPLSIVSSDEGRGTAMALLHHDKVEGKPKESGEFWFALPRT